MIEYLRSIGSRMESFAGRCYYSLNLGKMQNMVAISRRPMIGDGMSIRKCENIGAGVTIGLSEDTQMEQGIAQNIARYNFSERLFSGKPPVSEDASMERDLGIQIVCPKSSQEEEGSWGRYSTTNYNRYNLSGSLFSGSNSWLSMIRSFISKYLGR